MNIESIIKQIIPPADYQHRNGFSNISIIDKLTNHEKQVVEDTLITMLLSKDNPWVDTLIIETLGYLKSKKSLPILKNLLNELSNKITILIVATSIFEISNDDEMINIAINSLKKMDNKNDSYFTYNLIDAFYYLQKFNNSETKRIIKSYINHKDFLVAYNAKRASGLLTD